MPRDYTPPAITANTPGAIAYTAYGGRSGTVPYTAYRAPTLQEQAISALPPALKAAVDSGQIVPTFQQVGGGRAGDITAQNIIGFTSSAGGDKFNQYDVNGNYTGQFSNDGGGFIGQLIGILDQLAVSYFLPGFGEFFSTTLGVSSAMGKAFADVALQMAQGKTFEDSVKSVAIDSIVKTGSDAFAKDLVANSVDPKIANVITSAGGSAAKTVANGGSPEDILKNVEGAIAGSATTELTGSNTAGRTVSGGVTGGTEGALIGGATSLISEQQKAENETKAKEAGFPDYATYSEYKGDANAYQTARNESKAEASGFPDYATYQKYGGDSVAYEADVNTKKATDAGFKDYKTYEQYGGDLQAFQTEQNNLMAKSAGFPDYATYQQFGGDVDAYKTSLNPITVTSPTAPGNVTIEQNPIVTGNVGTGNVTIDTGGTNTLNNVTVTANATGNVANIDPILTGNTGTTLDPVTVTGKKEEPPGNVVITSGTLDNVTTGTTGEDGTGNVTTGNATSNATTTSTYKPNLFILGGTAPKATTSNSVLSQALGVSTGAAASRGAGEIEDPSTGKKRKNVWNEESLRLKDALGI